MGERFQQWSPKHRIDKRWAMGAIATPVFLGLVWWSLLPVRRPQPDQVRPTHSEAATLAQPHRDTLYGSIGAIVIAAGAAFLLLKPRVDNSYIEIDHLSGVDLSDADFSGVDLSGVDLSGANLSGANLRYANLSGANLKYTNLSGADLRYANLSGADLNCTLLTDANLSDANLSGALLLFVNSRETQNLEPMQLEAKPSPFLCNVALPAYASRPDVNPNRDCDRIPQLLSARYSISLKEAQEIVNEARQHQWT
ncbi:pentapeptide repeat-containing protein [filamentous cyanobacterium CCP3]|nr:pentapeptide repeat-containing protein [filamentous cyanobacterium CCP3]